MSTSFAIAVPCDDTFNFFAVEAAPPDELAEAFDFGHGVGLDGSVVDLGDLIAAGRDDLARATRKGLHEGWIARSRRLSHQAGRDGRAATTVREIILRGCPNLDGCLATGLAAWSRGHDERVREQALRSDWLRQVGSDDEADFEDHEEFLSRPWDDEYSEAVEFGGDLARPR